MRGRRAPRSECLSSLYLDVWSSKLTCYPRAEVIRHKLLYAILVEQKRDGVKWHHLQNGRLKTKGAYVRSNTPKLVPGGRKKESWALHQPSTSVGTTSFSFSGVV